MNSSAIEFTGIEKTYGRQPVLSGVDLTVTAGEYLGLVGVNGAGKTTLIKALLDFIHIDAGEIRIFGIPHTDLQARARLAFLPEKFTPPYYLYGRDFLRFMGELHGLAYDEERVRDMLRALDLDAAALAKPVRQYSKGMAQKLGLAACLLSNRELLVLDEPMSGLDPKARALFKEYLLGLRQHGQTLFFSTHLLADVEAICDRIAILHARRIRFVGTPRECRAHYRADDLEQAYLRCISDTESEVLSA
jgi:ABC-2 type transport system ATP-binding protein